jgi:hypothetical protein
MYGDYLRAAAGLFPTAMILAAMDVGFTTSVVLSGFGALFALFGVGTILRHGTRFDITEATLRASGLRRTSLAWEELDRMTLAYYSTRRDRRDGWMQLELCSGWKKVRLDSRIKGFGELVSRSARAAEARGLTLNAATLANLAALGISSRPQSGRPKASGDLA